MAVEVVRGVISVVFTFILSHVRCRPHSLVRWASVTTAVQGNLTRIAVGIFFLGLQIFHISLIIIMMAKFQQTRAERKPQRVVPVSCEPHSL